MVQTSAALAFTTLLALVPLLALFVAVGSAVPFVEGLLSRFDALLVETLLPSGSSGTIVKYLGNFAGKAQRLTIPGIVFLAATAIFLLATIEKAFNHVWRVEPRPLLARLKLYAIVVAVWPLVLGAIAALMSFAVSASLGVFTEPPWVRIMLLKGLSIALLGLFFAFLYYAVPNARVSRRGACLGGLFATLLFAAMQRGFELYLGSFGSFRSIYGAFATVPIFLVWLQLSWAVILLGGLLAATVFRPGGR
ncbi:MAG: YihY family inner membrane protein [Azonexus sp.]|nr:YihY family inner membrane protein [Betaproteobacteria bacterium]MBK8917296.1 YihY family inner membrane protein [Betaproteobacteria bacterium]MBP6035059.1 YihY family inner membrane protein [Azonexus sp.]MBP6905963.1 YihY family inner membrane protein [Azonexus sp.]